MSKYQNYVIYADYDLTLTNKQDILTDANRDAAHKFIELGGHFAPATGRGEKDVLAMHIDQNAPAIMHNGALIGFPDRQILKETEINQEEIKKACIDLYHRFPNLGLFLFTGDVYVIRTVDHASKKAVTYMSSEEAVKQAEKSGKKILNMCLDSFSEATDEARAYLNKQYPSIEAIYSAPGHMDVLPRGVSKGAAIKWLKKNYFTHNEKIIAIGDNVNDIEMLAAADIAMAVGNALPEVKEKADVILPDCDTPCLQSAMEYLSNEK